MGYEYGIWLVYDKEEFPTTHIGHITITCYMEKEDAISLYDELFKIYGKHHEVYVDCKNPLKFDINMYENDDNESYSWGYEGHLLENGMMTDIWSNIAEIAKKYKCDFSHTPHTSMFYSHIKQALQTHKMDENKVVKCSMEVVDITSDNPVDWHVIELSNKFI